MMNAECRKIEELLGGFVDGELRPEEHARVAAHVASCMRCGDALGAIERADHAVLALEASQPSPADLDRLVTRVQNVVQREEPRLARRSWREFLSWQRLVPAAAAAAVIFAVLHAMDRRFPVAERERTREVEVAAPVEGQPPAKKEPDGMERPTAAGKTYRAQGPRDEVADLLQYNVSEAIPKWNEDGSSAAKVSPHPEPATGGIAREDRREIKPDGPAPSSWGALKTRTPAPSPQRSMATPSEKNSAEVASELAEAEKNLGESPNAARELAVLYGMRAASESDSTLAASWELRAIALIAEAHAASGSPDDCQLAAAAIERFIAHHPADARIDSLRTLRAGLPCAP